MMKDKNENQTRKSEAMLDQIQAVIFDLDGTLVDSMWVWAAIDREYFWRHGLEVPENLQQRISGMSFSETADFIKEQYQISDSVEEMKDIWNAMAEEKYQREVPLKPGAFAFIKYLKERGIKTGVATSNSRHLVDLTLKARGIHGYMDSVHTACEVKHGKPEPDIYLLVAEDLQVAPEHCLVFEDIVEGIWAGKRAGMRTCAIADDATSQIWEEKMREADYAIQDYCELLKDGIS